jgi:hypothetical protein
LKIEIMRRRFFAISAAIDRFIGQRSKENLAGRNWIDIGNGLLGWTTFKDR